jgi:5-(carboxyamino)imidazole ribonucleotide mutase
MVIIEQPRQFWPLAKSSLPQSALAEFVVDTRAEGGAGPAIGIIMGSDSDWKTMQPAAQVLDHLQVVYEAKVVSAHRTPDYLFEYADQAEKRGLSLIIAGAGGAAHLPGMAAAKTVVPVIGVPVEATPLNGLDALLSIMQMPSEVGVATVGPKGAEKAARFAVAALAARNPALRGAVPKVVILAKDKADLPVLSYSEQYLAKLGTCYETVVLDPNGRDAQLADLQAKGAAVFIAGSHAGIGFACDVGKATALPVLAVPMLTPPVQCIDEFLRPFFDLPAGVATFAVGKPGAINAALFAAAIISGNGSETWKKLNQMRQDQVKRVRDMTLPTAQRSPG